MWANAKPKIVRVRAEWGEPREYVEVEHVGHAEAKLDVDRWAAQLAAGHPPMRDQSRGWL